MAVEVNAGLARAEALAPGHGQVDLLGYLRGSLTAGEAGGAVEAAARISEGWSAFGRGYAGWEWDDAGRRSAFGAVGGLRWRW